MGIKATRYEYDYCSIAPRTSTTCVSHALNILGSPTHSFTHATHSLATTTGHSRVLGAGVDHHVLTRVVYGSRAHVLTRQYGALKLPCCHACACTWCSTDTESSYIVRITTKREFTNLFTKSFVHVSIQKVDLHPDDFPPRFEVEYWPRRV